MNAVAGVEFSGNFQTSWRNLGAWRQGGRRAVQRQQQRQQQRQGSMWRSAGLAGILFGAVGFYEPAKDLHAKFFDPDYQEVESVALAKQQQRLQQKNLVCAMNMTRQAVPGEHQTTLRYGVCDNNDVLVEVYPDAKPAFQQWVSPENIIVAGPGRNAGLFPAAFAAISAGRPAAAAATITLAQMTLKTLCQAWQDGSKQTELVRVTDEGGTCYRERINVLSGRVEIREQVPCDVRCDVVKGKVD
jgi:hypothetical protein